MVEMGLVLDVRCGMICGADLGGVGVHWRPTGDQNRSWVLSVGGTRRIRLSRQELEELHRVLDATVKEAKEPRSV